MYMNITRWIWRYLLFSPINTTLAAYTTKRSHHNVRFIAPKQFLSFRTPPPFLMIFTLNTLCFDAQSCAIFNDKEFLK